MTVSFTSLVRARLSPEQVIYYLFCGALFVLPMGTSPFTILGICILGVWIFSGDCIEKRRVYLNESWSLPLVAMVVLVWIGVTYAPDPYGLGIKFAKKTYYWLYAFAIAGIAFTHRPAEHIIKAFLIGLFLNALVGFLQMATIVPTFDRFGATKYTGLSGGYNTLSLLLILAILMASFYSRYTERKKEKLTHIVLMLVYFSHLMILEGRGGYLTFALLSPIVLYNIFRKWHKGIIFMMYPVIIAIMLSSPIVRDRISLSISQIQYHLGADPSSAWGKEYTVHQDRFYMWRWAIDLFLEHPFTGVGTGGYLQAIVDKGGEVGIAHPHNNLLYVAVSYGIAGLFVFGWFFWVLLKAGWKNRGSPLGFFILSTGLVILVGGIADTTILNADPVFLLSVSTGLQSGLSKEGPMVDARERDFVRA